MSVGIKRRCRKVRNETEHKETAAGLAEERKQFAEHLQRLKEAGLSEEEIKRIIDPMESFHLQLKEELEATNGCSGEFDDLDDLRGLGHLLISLLAQGHKESRLIFAAAARPLPCNVSERGWQ